MNAMKSGWVLFSVLTLGWAGCGGSEQDEATGTSEEHAEVEESTDSTEAQVSQGLCYSNKIYTENGGCEWQGPLTARALRWCHAQGAKAFTGSKRFDTATCGWFRARSIFFTCC